MQPEKKCVSTEIIRLSFKLEIDFMCKIHQLLMYCRIRFFLLGILSCSEDIGCISTGNVYYMYHVTFTTIVNKLDQHGRDFENIYIKCKAEHLDYISKSIIMRFFSCTYLFIFFYCIPACLSVRVDGNKAFLHLKNIKITKSWINSTA